MKNKNPSMQFPCTFPLKVMGNKTEAFSTAVMAVFNRHLGPGHYSCDSRASRRNKYVSITITFVARSKEQLDAIYQELNDLDLVLMTL